MKCSDCAREMQVSYTERYCAWCSSDISKLTLYPGFIVMDDTEVGTANAMYPPHYVFKSSHDAMRWSKSLQDFQTTSIRKVFAPKRFEWSRRDNAVNGMKVAKKLFYLAVNHKFNPEDPFVILVPENYRNKATPMPSAEESEGDRLQDFFASSLNR